MVAFGKNGSDAVTAAVRLARATTERDVILHYGYHGFHDWFAVEDQGIRGIPATYRGLVHSFPYNDLSALEALFARFRDRVAAVLMEPFQVEMPRDGYLESVRELAHRNGALLIFDEMVTGFRVARGGAQELTGAVPDLACFGKALSNGMPLSALAGPRALMATSDSVGVDMGCRGETLSLAAARAALDVHAGEPIADRIAEIGRSIKAGIEAAAERERVPLRLVGHPARLELEFQDVGAVPKKTALGLFIQACMHQGIVTNGLILPTVAHDPVAVEETIQAAREALRVIRRAVEGGGSTLPPPFGPSSVGFLDSAQIAGGQLELRGWILPLGLPPETVELVDSQGGTFLAEILPRTDVAEAHPSIPGATRSGFSVCVPWDSWAPGSTWTIRCRRAGRVVFRARLVVGIRTYRRSMPREMRDGHVIEL
jgi:acetylornithine/succinyldiaminopimelate/putrescine aminotransferase